MGSARRGRRRGREGAETRGMCQGKIRCTECLCQDDLEHTYVFVRQSLDSSSSPSLSLSLSLSPVDVVT